MSWGLFVLKNCPDSRPPRGQEWRELEGWKEGGCEEFLDGMFLWRLSPHSAPPSPSQGLGHLPPPAMALCLFLPPKQQPTDTFFSQLTLPAGHRRVLLREPPGSHPSHLGLCRPAPPSGPHCWGWVNAWRGHACLFLEKKKPKNLRKGCAASLIHTVVHSPSHSGSSL